MGLLSDAGPGLSVPNVSSGIPVQSMQKPDIQKKAEAEYAFTKYHDLHVAVNPRSDTYFAETYPPNASDNPKENYIRPQGIPKNALGVEIYKPNEFSHHDLAGEVLHADPVANNVRYKLQETFTPHQLSILKEQGDYTSPSNPTKAASAFENENSKNGINPEQARLNNATDAFMRGYTVGQWPKEAIAAFNLNQNQKQILDNLSHYMKTGSIK